jgi:hypothetical protein
VKTLLRPAASLLCLALLGACGHPSAPAGGGTVGSADTVTVSGHVAAPGTKGSLLVFAVAGAQPEVGDRETLGVAAIDADGDFALTIPPAEAVAFAFLADGASDGVIDGGDPIAVLTGPSFASLGGGDVVTLSDVTLDFTGRKASASAIDVQRPGAAGPEFTPTTVP